MTLPADDHSESAKPESAKPDAAKPDAAKPDAAAPNFELVADETDKIGAKPAEAAKAEPAAAVKPPVGASSEPPKAETAKAEPSTEGSRAGKALAPAGIGPIDPFLAAAAGSKPQGDAPAPRSIGARMLDYSAHAAIIVGLIGFAWTVSDHVVNRPAKSDPAPVTAATTDAPTPARHDELADLRLANQKMHDEIRALRASVDGLRTAARRDTTAEQVRMLSAGLDNMKSTLASSKSETNAEISQLTGKVDRLQPTKVQSLADRVGRLERQSTDATATGSLGRDVKGSEARTETSRSESAKAVPTPPSKPQMLASAEEEHVSVDTKPQILSGWVVRDVYQGVALIEGRYGATREVVTGTSIPGAGTVKSIERHGGGWTVTTTKGQLAYAGGMPDREHESRDYRRSPYGRGYGPYGY